MVGLFVSRHYRQRKEKLPPSFAYGESHLPQEGGFGRAQRPSPTALNFSLLVQRDDVGIVPYDFV